MNKSLKFLLLTAAVLQSVAVFASDHAEQSPSPARSGMQLVATGANGDALVRISHSPSRTETVMSSLPVVNGFSFGSDLVTFDGKALMARAQGVLTKRAELAGNIVDVNNGNARLSRMYALPHKALELFERYENTIEKLHEATVHTQEVVDEVNQQLQPGVGKLVVAMKLMNLEIRHAAERAAALEELTASIEANKGKLVENVTVTAETIGMLVGKVANDDQSAIQGEHRQESVTSQNGANSDDDGEGSVTSF